MGQAWRRGWEEEQSKDRLTLFFTGWLCSSSSMSRSKLSTCGLRTPRTPWQRQRTAPKEPAPGGRPRLLLPLLAPLRWPVAWRAEMGSQLRCPCPCLLGSLRWLPVHTTHRQRLRGFLQYLSDAPHTHLLSPVPQTSDPEEKVTLSSRAGIVE